MIYTIFNSLHFPRVSKYKGNQYLFLLIIYEYVVAKLFSSALWYLYKCKEDHKIIYLVVVLFFFLSYHNTFFSVHCLMS